MSSTQYPRLLAAKTLSAFALTLTALLLPTTALPFDPANGDFHKADPTNIRVMEYNTEGKFIKQPASDAVFQRIITAIHPDIISFEEIDDSIAGTSAEIAQAIKTRLESYFTSETWTVHMGTSDGFNQNALCTRYGLSMMITDTTPGSDIRGITAGLVDLPDATYGSTDFYVMAVHFKSFGTQSDNERRQHYADAIINWMRDARTTGCTDCPDGDQINLPYGTPMLVVGDTNLGYLDGGDYAPYHPTRTLRDGDIYDNATYGPDSEPDWDGTDSGDAAPYDHVTGNANTHPSTTNAPVSRLDRFIYTDSTIHVVNRFVVNALTMSSTALTSAGLQTDDTVESNGASDHLPTVVDFALGPNTAPPGKLVINEFNYDNPGADAYTFVEFKNVGGREINLMAPVDYHLVTSKNNLPTAPPATNNQNRDINLQGVVPPGGLFVVYDSTTDSGTVATSLTAVLPPLQRQDILGASGGFTLENGPDTALALVTVEPWTTDTGTDTTTYAAVDAYMYEDSSPGVDNYFLTNSGNALDIALNGAQSSPYALSSASLSYSRNVGDETLNSYAQWTIPDAITPGLENASLVNTAPILADNTGISVSRGATMPINNTELRVTDLEQTPAQLVYTVTAFPAHGLLKVAASTLNSGGPDTFTQADIDGGNLSFVQDGVNTSPDSFTFTVSDGHGGTIGTTIFPIAVTAPDEVGDWMAVF